jgi:WD40 repeat protein
MSIKTLACSTCHTILNRLANDFTNKCCHNQQSPSIGCQFFHQEFHENSEKTHHFYELVDENLARLKLDIVDHFSELRNKIDIRRESLIQKINLISMEKIRRVDACEEAFLTRIEKEFKHRNPANSSIRMNYSLRNISKALYTQTNELKKKLELIESLKETLKDYSFSSGQNNLLLDEASFGHLNLNEHYQHLIGFSYKQENVDIFDVNSGSIVRTLNGHSGGVSVICILEKRNRLISGGWDGIIKIWDLNEFKCLLTLEGHRGRVRAFKLLNNDDLLASAAEDASIKLWDMASGNLITTLVEHRVCVRCIDALPNGSLLSGSYDATYKIWNLATSLCTLTIASESNFLKCLKVLPNARFASCSDDKYVRIWNYQTGQCICLLRGHSKASFHLELIESSVLATASEDRTIKLWSLVTYNCIQTFSHHSNIVFCVRQDKNGNLVSTSKDKTIIVWDRVTGKPLKTVKINSSIIKMVLSQ